MGLDVAPRSRIVRIGDQLGVASEFVEGVPRVSSRMGSASSVDELAAFEYLLGNGDAHGNNIRIDSGGHARSFDHAMAFMPYLATDSGVLARNLGSVPPQTYSPRVLAALRGLTRETLVREIGQFVTEAQIDTLLFRRDLMLRAAELRAR
jgi:hypothetical protein